MTFGARALIRLGALEHNLKVIREAVSGSKVMAVVKANAYGHGLLAAASALTEVDAFAVARLPEAVLLHEAGIEQPITVLAGALTAAELDEAMRRGFQLVVHSPEQIDLLQAASNCPITVWLKFDTGMNRLGFSPQQAESLLARLSTCQAVGEIRLMSHLASADQLDSAVTKRQLARFGTLVRGFKGAVSIANTPGALGWPQFRSAHEQLGFEGDHWVRAGIALFGISPFAGRTGAELGLLPVMQFEGRLVAIKPLLEGARVGYQGRYRAQSDSTLGIISAGYGDGYSRHFRSGTPVLLNGRRVPLIGNVSMDLIAVDLGAGTADKVGDVATLWGPELPVEEVAGWADAIPYELVCGVMNREAAEIVS